VRGQVPGKLLLGHALTVGGYGAALRTMTDGSLGRHLSRRIDESGQSLTPPATTYSVFTANGSAATGRRAGTRRQSTAAATSALTESAFSWKSV
jgi:hypothetical protein